jgi:beta-galactosidase
VLYIVRRVAISPRAPTDPGYELEQYRPRPTVFADWTPENRGPHTERVEVYSNCAQVTLSLNGTQFGTLPLPADAAPRIWQVTFAPGTLEARCGDPEQTKTALTTAGEPAAVVLHAENDALGTGFDQVAFVRATIVDSMGTPVPSAAVPLEFSVRGPGLILATDNADNAYTGVFALPRRSTLDGRAIVLLRATKADGTLHIEAASPGLRTGSLDLKAH